MKRELAVGAWVWPLRTCSVSLAAAERTFEDVADRYEGPGRYYHDLAHAVAVTQNVRAVGRHTPALQLAAMLHDVIYDSRAKDNEERSAEYAREILRGLQVRPELREEVARLILLTKTHTTTVADQDGQTLIDADLAILSASQDVYDDYAAAIRREYAWVPEADYRAGRRRVLESFLVRPSIYLLRATHAQCEKLARANLTREIVSLARPPSS